MRAHAPKGVRFSFALVAAMALVAVACDGGSGTREITETSSDTSFLDPLTNEQEAQDLFEVEADDAEYWRLRTLDHYDGESWTADDPEGSEDVQLSAPATLPPPGVGISPDARTLDQTFRILRDLSDPHAVPMAQTAEEISGPIGDFTWDPARSSTFIDGVLDAGTTYTVRSRIVVPTPEELDGLDLRDPSIDARWTALPGDLDPRIAAIAGRWTAHATSDYQKVLAIQQRFQEEDFVYSTDVDAAVDGDAVVEFLTRTKAGFCQHYSSAMAVMVRTLGLPARIGLGFRPGTAQDDGSYLVTTSDAHVWVEVLFPGYGWLQFEPEAGTPHPNAEPGTYLNP
jgi:transglutaminase-like putative cysteine protease